MNKNNFKVEVFDYFTPEDVQLGPNTFPQKKEEYTCFFDFAYQNNIDPHDYPKFINKYKFTCKRCK